MQVKELTLHNFRGIKDLHLEFDTKHNVVVLVGVNGVGKSSILDCISFLFHYYQMICDDFNESGEIVYEEYKEILSDSDIYIGAKRTISKIKVNFFYDDNDMEWEVVKFDRLAFADDKWNKTHKKYWKSITTNRETRILISCYYYYSGKVINLDSMSMSYEAETIIDFNDFSKWFKSEEDLENEKRLTDRIEYRDPILEAVRTSIYSLLGEGYENLTFKRSIGLMSIRKFGRELSLDMLSDGEKYLLAMVGDLSRRLADIRFGFDGNSIENLYVPALVLIDEIELHLHPAWQRSIIPKLTEIFPYCQFIVTTHSPQVLSHVDPECIHILDYEGDNVVVKRPESSYGLDSNRILEDILSVSKRPQEIADRLQELFERINDNDLESARKIVAELSDRIGSGEPELAKAEATIKRREIIGR